MNDMHVCMVDLNNILCFGDGNGKCEFLLYIFCIYAAPHQIFQKLIVHAK